jgi:hypothetical protein
MRDSTTELLVELLRRAYDVAAWHGPNLKGALRGVDAARAGWRAGPGRRSIGEIALHAACWKSVARRRLLGLPRGSFARAGSNWFALEDGLSEREWREIRALLDGEQSQLLEAVAGFEPGRWGETPASRRHTWAGLVEGVAFHDVYHAGQIELIKRLRGEGG